MTNSRNFADRPHKSRVLRLIPNNGLSQGAGAIALQNWRLIVVYFLTDESGCYSLI
ncbi:hypothetical protein [Microcoleus sp. D3_18a_C4]|uniref:hypothetical protein n=1 Tax=Microcoleus sp. D3_18a_C4 TaxID=3055332 RepID=UPI002FD1179A